MIDRTVAIATRNGAMETSVTRPERHWERLSAPYRRRLG
jgi:hypothetical protein